MEENERTDLMKTMSTPLLKQTCFWLLFANIYFLFIQSYKKYSDSRLHILLILERRVFWCLLNDLIRTEGMFSRSSINFEAPASELHRNLQEVFPLQYLHSVMFSQFESSTTKVMSPVTKYRFPFKHVWLYTLSIVYRLIVLFIFFS